MTREYSQIEATVCVRFRVSKSALGCTFPVEITWLGILYCIILARGLILVIGLCGLPFANRQEQIKYWI